MEYEKLQKELQAYKEKHKPKSRTDAAVMTDILLSSNESSTETLSQNSSKRTTSVHFEKQDASTMTDIKCESSTQVASSSTSFVSSSLSTSPRIHKKCQTVISVVADYSSSSEPSRSGHKRSYSDGNQPCGTTSVKNKWIQGKVQVLDDRLMPSQDDQDKPLQLVKPKSGVAAMVEKKASGNIRQHKCLWQKEVKMLQIKLRSMRKQVNIYILLRYM